MASNKIEQLADENDENLKFKIIGMSNELVSQGRMTDKKSDEIQELARSGELTEAITLLEDIVVEEEEEDVLDFSDEEKDLFAQAFEESINEVVDEVEKMRKSLQSLIGGVSRGDMKSYLRGQKSSRTKKKVEQLFEAIDSFEAGSNSNKKLARVLCAFNNNLKIKETEQMLSEMRAKVE